MIELEIVNEYIPSPLLNQSEQREIPHDLSVYGIHFGRNDLTVLRVRSIQKIVLQVIKVYPHSYFNFSMFKKKGSN